MNRNYRVALQYDSDGYWVAEHPEVPGCIADGETAQEALASLDVSRELWIESRLASGLEIPEPENAPQYSGRFVLRIAKCMHRELAQEAEYEGVSLNTHISNVLANRHAKREIAPVFRQSPYAFMNMNWTAEAISTSPRLNSENLIQFPVPPQQQRSQGASVPLNEGIREMRI